MSPQGLLIRILPRSWLIHCHSTSRTISMAYRTFDQNGNPLEVTGTEVKDSKLTFISDNVLLIELCQKKLGGTNMALK